jgi:ribose 5-phosphate isomerase B
MKIHIGCDHAGFELKEFLKSQFEQEHHEVVDHGTYSLDSTDYPQYAHEVSNAVSADKESLGVLICGSANGVCITANKHQEIRAALCWNSEVAQLARAHNNANIIGLPARFISKELAKEMCEVFLSTAFEGGRHEKRVSKIPIQ